MTQEFIESLKIINGVEITEGDMIKITLNNSLSIEDVEKTLSYIYDYEKSLDNVNILLDLKGLETELLSECIKYSLLREDLKDPVMILNIINLIKIYNTLDDSYFEDENIYVNSIEDLLDLKLEIHTELAEFIKKTSMYFISLFKSYNKIMFTPLDNHKKLPDIYKAIFLSTDLLTLSGIFASSESFNTEECVYIEDSLIYISSLLLKGSMGVNLMENFFKD